MKLPVTLSIFCLLVFVHIDRSTGKGLPGDNDTHIYAEGCQIVDLPAKIPHPKDDFTKACCADLKMKCFFDAEQKGNVCVTAENQEGWPDFRKLDRLARKVEDCCWQKGARYEDEYGRVNTFSVIQFTAVYKVQANCK